MLTLRLSRIGKKKQPLYRLIVSEKTKDPWGRSLEILGSYNPRSKQAALDVERVKHWIGKGATVSDSVWNLLVAQKIVAGKTRRVVPRPKTKVTEAVKAEEKKEAPAA